MGCPGLQKPVNKPKTIRVKSLHAYTLFYNFTYLLVVALIHKRGISMKFLAIL